MNEEQLKAHIIEHKEDGRQEIENMKASIEAVGNAGSMLPSHIKMVDRKADYPVSVDGKSATILAKTFQKMAEQYVDHLDDQGSEIDIDSYIMNKVKGINDPCLVSEKLGQGATVLISIDGSGSMSNSGDLDSARNLLATLYKASEKVKNIKLIGNVWSSNYDGDVGVTIINSADDLDKIGDASSYLFTPTHEALIFSAKQLRGQEGRKKLMIMITDGVPQYYKNQFEIPAGTLHKMCKTALKKSLRISPRIMCIDITNHWKYSEMLKEIFGRRLITLDGMNSASKFVIKEFRKIVSEVMR
jgi:Mg-chelatase subunit ChlD